MRNPLRYYGTKLAHATRRVLPAVMNGVISGATAAITAWLLTQLAHHL